MFTAEIVEQLSFLPSSVLICALLEPFVLQPSKSANENIQLFLTTMPGWETQDIEQVLETYPPEITLFVQNCLQ